MTYPELLSGTRTPGRRVAVIGAGGIGVDVSVYLVAGGPGISPDGGPTYGHSRDVEAWKRHWGVVDPAVARAGLGVAVAAPPAHEVHLMQRKKSTIGNGLGKTTGWVHRQELKTGDVHQYTGVTYERISGEGVHIRTDDGTRKLVQVDTVVLCTGQVSERSLADELATTGQRVHVIGGADVAAELDAKRAIKHGVELAAAL